MDKYTWRTTFALIPRFVETDLTEGFWVWMKTVEYTLYWNGLGGIRDGWRKAYRLPGGEHWLEKEYKGSSTIGRSAMY